MAPHRAFAAGGSRWRVEADSSCHQQRAVFHSARHFAKEFRLAPNSIALVTLGGRWQQVNRATCSKIGDAEEELRAKTTQELMLTEDIAEDVRQRAACSLAFESFHIEPRYLHKNGHVVWLHQAAR